MSTEPNIIRFSEVKKHSKEDSVWTVIHNDVYDVTKYLYEHPGGERPLIDAAGTDSTQAFEDVGHSEDAREIMKKYKIGSLPPGEDTTIKKASKNNCEHVPKIQRPEKTWRTYDGGTPSIRPTPSPKPVCKTTSTPRIERRVQSIVVPRERISSNLKWAVLALAGALVIGIVLKKYVMTA